MKEATRQRLLRNIDTYIAHTDNKTQFYDACKIAQIALGEVKQLTDALEALKNSTDWFIVPLDVKEQVEKALNIVS